MARRCATCSPFPSWMMLRHQPRCESAPTVHVSPHAVLLQVTETPELERLLAKLQERVAVELRTQDALQRVLGMLEPIVASAS